MDFLHQLAPYLQMFLMAEAFFCICNVICYSRPRVNAFYFQEIIHSRGAELFTLLNTFVIDFKIGHRQALLLDTTSVTSLELFPDLRFVIF